LILTDNLATRLIPGCTPAVDDLTLVESFSRKNMQLRKHNHGTYSDYLASAHWLKISEECKRLAGYRCQTCNSNKGLTAHHRTYQRLGEELSGDLCCLCHICHTKIHIPLSLGSESLWAQNVLNDGFAPGEFDCWALNGPGKRNGIGAAILVFGEMVEGDWHSESDRARKIEFVIKRLIQYASEVPVLYEGERDERISLIRKLVPRNNVWVDWKERQ